MLKLLLFSFISYHGIWMFEKNYYLHVTQNKDNSNSLQRNSPNVKMTNRSFAWGECQTYSDKKCTPTPNAFFYLHDNGWERTDPRSSRWSCRTICRASGQKPPWTTSSTLQSCSLMKVPKKSPEQTKNWQWWADLTRQDKRARLRKKQLVANASLISSIWSSGNNGLTLSSSSSSEAVVFFQLSAAFLDTCRRRCQSPRFFSQKSKSFPQFLGILFTFEDVLLKSVVRKIKTRGHFNHRCLNVMHKMVMVQIFYWLIW